jgi:5-methylcytosine-specific restriction endonuclease McrA
MLSEIKPQQKSRVYDLVAQAGLDTADWAKYKRPYPAANPRYCYEWAFWEASKLVVLCLWYRHMKEQHGTIYQEVNYRKVALKSSTDSTLATRAKRARRMDEAFQLAQRERLPIRVIVVDGPRRDENGAKASKVERRMLDPIAWAVSSYDATTGVCRVERGLIPCRFADQFSAPSESDPERRSVYGEVFVRSPEVRRRVLERSKGRCESCREKGFKMPGGRLFLETHHIVPLSEGGADADHNVIALCPNEHREAHHGVNASKLRRRFAEIVGHPEERVRPSS